LEVAAASEFDMITASTGSLCTEFRFDGGCFLIESLPAGSDVSGLLFDCEDSFGGRLPGTLTVV